MAEELPVTHHTEIFHTRHCTYNLHVHLVFVVKYRKKIFTAEILKDLKIIFETICLELDADLIEFDGEQDHVHLLILYPPKLAISDLVFRLKGVSSRLIRQRNYHSVTRHRSVNFSNFLSHHNATFLNELIRLKGCSNCQHCNTNTNCLQFS